MSAELPISLTVEQAHHLAVDEVNRWRGHCIESYARIERAAEKTLDVVAAAKQQSKRPPIMFGDRIKALQTLFGPGGEHSDTSLSQCLAKLSEALALRNCLVHSTGHVRVDPKGDWVCTYRFDPMRKGEKEQVVHLERACAKTIEQSLTHVGRSLCSRLENFRKSLELAPD